MDHNKTESRRDFLKKAGKFAVYTPPALMVMSQSSHATFTKSCCGDIDKNYQSSGSDGGSHGGWLQDLLKWFI